MSTLRRILLSLLSRYFRIARLPPSIKVVSAATPQITLVTQGDSLVLAAMIDSFARRSGLRGAAYCSGAAGLIRPAARTADMLYWVAIDDEAALSGILHDSPQHRFSTLNIFRVRGPVKSTPKYRMSLIKQLGLLIGCRFLLIICGEPIALSRPEAQSGTTLIRQLKLDFYRNLKIVRGNPFQGIEAQAQAVLGGSEFDREIRVVAARLGKTERTVRAMARREFYRMAANPQLPLYWIAAPICNFLIKRLFAQINTFGLDKLTAAVKDATVVLVPMHRSHLDYIVLGATLYNSNLNTPVVAAGVNLNFWPFGFLIRSLGGYFVKRNARHDRIHALLLKRYVTYLVKRGHLQEFFIEGGRSRSGKMGQPRIGLLGTIIAAYTRGLRKDIIFVPVSITYENVIEDEVYGTENTGRSKTKENLASLFRAREFFRKKYGDVLVRFGAPVSVAAVYGTMINPHAPERDRDSRALVHAVANQLTRTIRDQSDISLTNLAYTALMAQPAYGLPRRQLIATVRDLAALATLVADELQAHPRFTPSLELFLQGRENILEDLVRGGVAQLRNSLGSDVFYIPGGKRFTADFYKNSSIHIFLIPALLAILELTNKPLEAAQLKPWHEILSYDFQLSTWEDFSALAQRVIGALQSAEILSATESGLRFKTRHSGCFLPGLLQGNLQALLWVEQNLRTAVEMKEDGRGLGSCSYAELLQHLQSGFRVAMYLGAVTRTEASSQTSLSAALESLRSRQVVSFDEGELANRRITLLKPDPEYGLLSQANVAIRQWQLGCCLAE